MLSYWHTNQFLLRYLRSATSQPKVYNTITFSNPLQQLIAVASSPSRSHLQ